VVERSERDAPAPLGVVATYDSVSVAEARAVLAHGIERRVPLLTLTGKVGSGTSATLRSLHARFAEAFDLVMPATPPASIPELVVPLLRLVGRAYVDAPATELVQTLTEALAARDGTGRPAALLLDDAEALPDEVLEVLTVLGPRPGEEQARVSVVLAGRPGLLSRLAQPRLGALRYGLTIDVRMHVSAPVVADAPTAPVRHLALVRRVPRRRTVALSALVGCLCAATTLYIEEQRPEARVDHPPVFAPGAVRSSALAALVVPREADAAPRARRSAFPEDPTALEARRIVLAFEEAVASADGETLRSLLAADVRYNGAIGVDVALDDPLWLARGTERPRLVAPDRLRREPDGSLVVEAPFHVPYRDVAGMRGEVVGRARWRLARRGERLKIVQVDYDVVPHAGTRAGDG
jgi:type II secretory pathway predicted ATPase ExeA